jgi:hypothetical protein
MKEEIQIQEVVKDYSGWTSNESFGVATAAFLLIIGVSILFLLVKNYFERLLRDFDEHRKDCNNRMDTMNTKLTEISATWRAIFELFEKDDKS